MGGDSHQKKALPIPQASEECPTAVEVLRAWCNDDTVEVTLRTTWNDPGNWGVLLVDLARHAAKAYAADGREYDEALRRIRAGFDAEWSDPTDDLATVTNEG